MSAHDPQRLSSMSSIGSLAESSVPQTYDFICQRVLGSLEDDLLAADYSWSLFVAAAFSYRHDTVLRPFPPMYIEEYNEKNYSKLVKTIREVPAFDEMLATKCGNISEEPLRLVDWVLNRSCNNSLHQIDISEFETIKQMTGQTVPTSGPDYIFEVVQGKTGLAKFEAIRKGRQVMYAFHGSRLENFHSILNHGLHNHMNKNALFGEGTYLSSELSVSMAYSPDGSSWHHSCVGSSLSCIAVCELIDDSSVKRHVREASGSSDRNLSNIRGSLGGEIPEKYYVVRNNEMLRLKYILVFVQEKLHKDGAVGSSRRRRLSRWVMRHKFFLFVTFYAVLLIAIGLANSRTFQNLVWKTWSR